MEQLALTPREERIASLYRLYEERLHAAGGVDFDELLLRVVRLLETVPQALDWYRSVWSYVLVDEYQDTNRAQYRIVQMLTEQHRNLCVVGDPDQSVYRWRGADLRNILDFETDYPDCRVIALEQNYRSTKRILEIASHVIANNKARKDKRLWTENGEGDRRPSTGLGRERRIGLRGPFVRGFAARASTTGRRRLLPDEAQSGSWRTPCAAQYPLPDRGGCGSTSGARSRTSWRISASS